MSDTQLDPVTAGLIAEAILYSYDQTASHLTWRHFRVLLSLGCNQYASDEEPITQDDLARHLGWPGSTLSRIIGDLAGFSGKVKEPLIEIGVNPENPKQHLLRLSAAAYELRDAGTALAADRLANSPYPINADAASEKA